jgi:hypothetical protein
MGANVRINRIHPVVCLFEFFILWTRVPLYYGPHLG